MRGSVENCSRTRRICKQGGSRGLSRRPRLHPVRIVRTALPREAPQDSATAAAASAKSPSA
eukprot:2532886-Pyramimonas_sp.AAC.1